MAYLLEVDDLHTFFKTKKGIVKAVNGVSYRVEPGKTLGIVGESGSGKSVTTQSFIPLLLDGDKRTNRIDPFGTKSRKIENAFALAEAL